MVSYVQSALSTTAGFLGSTFAPVQALKTSQNAVISTIAKAVLTKYTIALGLAVLAVCAIRKSTFTQLKADWNQGKYVDLFWQIVKPVAYTGAAVFVAVAL
jgi:hypothetical protein